MTFCLGISVEEGLVGIADTRVTSGTECITARKVSVYHQERGSMFVMMSGLRSLRDKTLTYFEEALADQDEPFDRLFKAVNLFTQQVRQVADEDKKPLSESGLDFNIHALIGGQMENDGQHKLYLVYPEGNWVTTGTASPYHIIGSTRYGKPVLDRALTHADSMRHAFKVGCLSFDSTRISSADVGFPIDVVLCRRNSFQIIEQRYNEKDLRQISNWWQERIRQAVQGLPSDWLEELFSRVYPVDEKQAPAAD
jgi:putative proteasome-type protease